MTNDKNMTPEQLEKAKSAPSAAALLTMAQENGITLTAEDAAVYYAQLHPEEGALSDTELDNVTGGCSGGSVSTFDMQVDYLTNNYCAKDQHCAANRLTNIVWKNELKQVALRGQFCKMCSHYDEVNAYFRSKGWPEFPRDMKAY